MNHLRTVAGSPVAAKWTWVKEKQIDLHNCTYDRALCSFGLRPTTTERKIVIRFPITGIIHHVCLLFMRCLVINIDVVVVRVVESTQAKTGFK